MFVALHNPFLDQPYVKHKHVSAAAHCLYCPAAQKLCCLVPQSCHHTCLVLVSILADTCSWFSVGGLGWLLLTSRTPRYPELPEHLKPSTAIFAKTHQMSSSLGCVPRCNSPYSLCCNNSQLLIQPYWSNSQALLLPSCNCSKCMCCNCLLRLNMVHILWETAVLELQHSPTPWDTVIQWAWVLLFKQSLVFTQQLFPVHTVPLLSPSTIVQLSPVQTELHNWKVWPGGNARSKVIGSLVEYTNEIKNVSI